MKQVLVVLLAALLALPPVGLLRAQDKPVAALGRVATLGDISEGQKRIISTRLESLLSEPYDLVSQEQYARAEEAAFASLDLEKCTEEECIRKIQEILQVDRLFILQIIKEQEFTQLSLNLVREDSKRVVEGVCEECSITQLYEQIEKLARQLIAEDLGQAVAQPTPAPQLEVEEEDGGFPWWAWVLIAGGIAGLASAGGSSEPGTGPGNTDTGSLEVTW